MKDGSRRQFYSSSIGRKNECDQGSLPVSDISVDIMGLRLKKNKTANGRE